MSWLSDLNQQHRDIEREREHRRRSSGPSGGFGDVDNGGTWMAVMVLMAIGYILLKAFGG